MLILLIAVCVAIAIVYNPRTEEEQMAPGCNAAVWIAAIVLFLALLSVASIVGAAMGMQS